MNRYPFHNVLLVLATLFASPQAFCDVVVLDFEGLGISNYDPIPQTYGDNSQFDVSHRQLDGFGDANVVLNDLYFWTTGYGDMVNVVFGNDSTATHVAEIRFESLSANLVTLNSFDTADYYNSADSQTFRVYDGSYNLLYELTNFDVSGTRDTILPNVSAQTLIVQWDYPWGVALDNISLTAVPEPNSLAVLSICLGTLILRRSRKTQL